MYRSTLASCLTDFPPRRMRVPASFRLSTFANATSSQANPWFWRLPAIAVICLIAGVIGFVMFTLRQDQEEQRASLLSDVLWLEQNLRFQFERNEELLGRLAQDLLQPGAVDEAALMRARQTISKDTAISQLIWFDAAQKPRGELPPRERAHSAQQQAAIASALQRARAFAKAAYCQVSNDANDMGGPVLCVAVPSYDGTQLRGFVVGIYPLQRLLSTQVAWWFSERYRLTVNDQRGHEIVSKSKVVALHPALSYEVAFDPPGNGLMLHVDTYSNGPRIVPLLFVGAVILFGVTLLWSLWMLLRHTARRHAAEQALQREYQFRRAMEDSLHTGLRARDLEGRTTYVNRAFCEMVGWSAEELIGMSSPMQYWVPEEIEATSEMHKRVLAGEISHQGFELRFRRRNGEIFDALIYEAPLMDADGTHFGWMASVLDITDRKRAEELARMQQERLEATVRLVTMGEMASTLAHELNQPLAAIWSYASGCVTGLENGMPHAQLGEAMQKVAHQSQRAGNIIRRIQNFVRRSEPRQDQVELTRVVSEAAALLESSARKRHVRITLAFPHELPGVAGDATLLEQVVVNLMRNGMDAMNDTPEGERQLRVSVSSNAEVMEVCVTDRGSGISVESAEKLYTPFFTTKSEGMGMGLNICRSIIEWHRGRLWFEPNPGGGTQFRFTLPRENP
ncbi:MAG: two-component system, LuxR family, sensor histidine kinase [Rhodocyclales bacterium]|nr:two-component system, LuxR family, sensor histidine kinase [Rhodocyclales bacterium]